MICFSHVGMEFQYGVLRAAGVIYPHCLCPSNQTCKDRQRFSENQDLGNYFLPIEGVNDGIVDPNGKLGFWLAPRGFNLSITLDLHSPAMVSFCF